MFGLDEAKKSALKGVRDVVGAQWKPFWRGIALRVRDAEKAYKEGDALFSSGGLRKASVMAAAHEHLDPLLAPYPDLIEAGWWYAFDHVLDKYLARLKEKLGTDWVSRVEDFESEMAYPLETLLDMDLDGDGVTGRPPAVAALALLAVLVLAGDARAAGRPALIDHLPQDHKSHVREVEPAPTPTPVTGRRPPLVEHYQPTEKYLAELEADRQEAAKHKADAPLLKGFGIETWIGHSTARKGIDTGVGLVKREGDWSLGVQAGENRAGICAGWKRVGVNYLWDPRDGSRELGGYIVPVRF